MPERPVSTRRRDAGAVDDELPEGEKTGEHQASRDFVREVNRSGLWKTSWALICTAGVIVTGTLWAYRAAAAEARDAGVEASAEVKRQADATQRELERFQKEVTSRMDRSDASQGRTEQKLDKLLDGLNIRNPAPAPKDAGP